MAKGGGERAVQLLLLQAWRERWTDIEWGIQLKKLLSTGTGKESQYLPDLILSEALVGMSPNTLMLSYLQNAISSQVVPAAPALEAVVRHDDPTKLHCTKTLMETTNAFLPNLVRDGNSANKDPLEWAKALLGLLKWALSSAHKSLVQIAENGSCSMRTAILEQMCEMLRIVLNDECCGALIAVAASDDTDLVREISHSEANVRGTLAQLEASLVTAAIRENVDASLKLLTKFTDRPKDKLSTGFGNMVCNPCVTVILQQEVIMNPGGAVETIVAALMLVEKIDRRFSRARLLCDVMRAAFLGIIYVQGGPDELRWVAFTYLKIPQIFVRLQSQSADTYESMERGCQLLLRYSSLVETLESKYPSINCLRMFFDLLTKNGLLKELQVERLLENEKNLANKKLTESTTQATPTLILRAEPTGASILKTLEADYSKNQEPLLGVLCHMMSGKSFELIVAAAAANGKLRNFVLKLLRFNEFAKSSPGEGNRTSVTRSQLFDISFLMLCHIGQLHGLEVMENRDGDPETMFYHWACRYLPLDGRYRSLTSYKTIDQTKIDSLLHQINAGGELKTSLVRWFDVCNAVPFAIREVLHAWEAGVITTETVQIIADNLKSKLGCLAVVACAWLCSYLQATSQSMHEKPKQLLRILLNPSTRRESDPPCPNYTERAQLMSWVCAKMSEHALAENSSPENVLTDNNSAKKLLTKTLRQIFDKGTVENSSVQLLEKLLRKCEIEWFCESVVTEMLNHTHPDDLNQAVGLTFGIFFLSIEQLSLCFLNETLPKYLLGSEYRLQALVDPKGKSLARLAVLLIGASVQIRSLHLKSPTFTKRASSLDLYETKFDEQVKTEETESSKHRKEEVLTLESEFKFDIHEPMDECEQYDTKDKLNQAMSRLFSVFASITDEPITSPRSSYMMHFIVESARCNHARYILQFMPGALLQHFQSSMPGVLTVDTLITIAEASAARGRVMAANAVCRARVR